MEKEEVAVALACQWQQTDGCLKEHLAAKQGLLGLVLSALLEPLRGNSLRSWWLSRRSR